MKCSSMKTIKVVFRRPHPAGNFYDFLLCATFIRQQVSSGPGEGDHYKQVKLQLSFSIIISTFHAYFCVLVGLSISRMSLISAK